MGTRLVSRYHWAIYLLGLCGSSACPPSDDGGSSSSSSSGGGTASSVAHASSSTATSTVPSSSLGGASSAAVLSSSSEEASSSTDVTDGGVLPVTSETVESLEASELGDDVDSVEAATYLASAAAEITDDTTILDALDALPTRPPSPMTDCRHRSPLLNPAGFEIDYRDCGAVGSAGIVNIRKSGNDAYLIDFTDTFVFRGIKVKGYALLTKRDSKKYTLSSADGTGANVAQALIRISRAGSHPVSRDLKIGGNLDVVDTPLSAFDYGADGRVIDPANTNREHELGLGGLPGGSKSDPLRILRPASGRCPEHGVLHLRGHFLLKLAFVYAVVIANQRYETQVDLDPRDFEGVLKIGFDVTQSSGIRELDLRPNVSLRADKLKIRDAVSRSGHDSFIKQSILSHLDTHDAPLIPDDAFSAAARAVLALWFTNGDVCGRN